MKITKGGMGMSKGRWNMHEYQMDRCTWALCVAVTFHPCKGGRTITFTLTVGPFCYRFVSIPPGE